LTYAIMLILATVIAVIMSVITA